MRQPIRIPHSLLSFTLQPRIITIIRDGAGDDAPGGTGDNAEEEEGGAGGETGEEGDDGEDGAGGADGGDEVGGFVGGGG